MGGWDGLQKEMEARLRGLADDRRLPVQLVAKGARRDAGPQSVGCEGPEGRSAIRSNRRKGDEEKVSSQDGAICRRDL